MKTGTVHRARFGNRLVLLAVGAVLAVAAIVFRGGDRPSAVRLTGVPPPAAEPVTGTIRLAGLRTADGPALFLRRGTPLLRVPEKRRYLERQALVFSLDQGFANGLIATQDLIGLRRIIARLKGLQARYEVYALLTPTNPDPKKIGNVLDALAADGIPFVLDVCSSDVLTLGVTPVHAPYDVRHGLAISPRQAEVYKRKYGAHFAGMRAHETFAQNFTIVACRKRHHDWCRAYQQYLPGDPYYQKALIEPYVKLAHDRGMFFLWSDWYWSAEHRTPFDLYGPSASHPDGAVGQLQNEQELRELITAYPNTTIVMYANNEPNEASRPKRDAWPQALKPLLVRGALGFGLSDQSWMYRNAQACPVAELDRWATSAFARGARVVEFEPVWYWWHLPVGNMERGGEPYPRQPKWGHRGYANLNFNTLSNDLGVRVPLAFNVVPLKNCLDRPGTADVALLSWNYFPPDGSYANVGDDPNFAHGYSNKAIAGQGQTHVPNGFHPPLVIQPGKTYYVKLYDAARKELTAAKSFSLPACPPPAPPVTVHGHLAD